MVALENEEHEFWSNWRTAPQSILVKGVCKYLDNHKSPWKADHKRYAAAATKAILMEYETPKKGPAVKGKFFALLMGTG